MLSNTSGQRLRARGLSAAYLTAHCDAPIPHVQLPLPSPGRVLSASLLMVLGNVLALDAARDMLFNRASQR